MNSDYLLSLVPVAAGLLALLIWKGYLIDVRWGASRVLLAPRQKAKRARRSRVGSKRHASKPNK